MGVKDLWNIISPSSERRPLYELQGKVIAIDLSGWIVDSQSVTDNVIQPKMYLRNLFFRTAFLLMNEISPVFVLEGTAPSLKHKTIAKRNEIRNGPTQKKTNRKGGRSNFNRVLKECEDMLKYMGISCVRGQGEAEAMCALLNAEGLVDGCISQDSDCFLYGAKVVYRNFCTSSQGNRGTSGGSIDEYNIEKIERIYGLGRNKMIALALLCGCDYDNGISGVGKEAALKLFKVVDETKIIERMKSWKTDSTFSRMEAEIANPNICTTCGHKGKMRVHLKSGCGDCGTATKCNDSYKEKRVLISNELLIRKKTFLVDNFPNEELIDEFLHPKETVPSKLDLQWKLPQVLKFVNFMENYVLWEVEYAYAKILPLLTRWQVRNLPEIPDDRRLSMRNLLIPEKIKKPRNIKGVATYEIVWEDKEGIFKGMTLPCISDKENDSEEPPAEPTELATLEPQHLFKKCYPLLVEEFETAKLAKKKKPAKPRGRKAKSTEDETEEKTEKKKAQRRPRKPKITENVKNRKMDEFIKTNMQTLEESFESMTITPKRKKKDNVTKHETKSLSDDKINSPQINEAQDTERLNRILNGSLLKMFNALTPEDFPSEAEDENMSEIIDNICSQTNSMNISFPRNQSVHYMNDLELESNLDPKLDLEPKLDLDPKLDIDPKVNVDPKFDSDHKMDLEPKPDLEFESSERSPNTFNGILKPMVKSRDCPQNSMSSPMIPPKLNESENFDCTLKQIIDSHKNAADCKKKPVSIMRSPNVFACKKARKKFDVVNFTFEHKDTLEPEINYKISEDCIKRSERISYLLNRKSTDGDDSMERIDRINASLERFLFGQKLFKDPENSGESIHKETLIQKEANITDESQLKSDSEKNIDYENVLEVSNQRVSMKIIDSVKNKNRSHFSLERSLHVQNLIKDFKNSISNATNIDDSVKNKIDKSDFVDEVESLNSSLERLRFAQQSDINNKGKIENSETDNFDLSRFKLEEKSINVANSSLDLLPIIQNSEDSKSTKINIRKVNQENYQENQENKDISVQKFDLKENFHYKENESFHHKENESFHHKENESFHPKENEIASNFDQEENKEISENLNQVEKKISFQNNDEKIRIIPDEIECTDESDMFDFSSECSQYLQSPPVKFTEQYIRKSTNAILEKLKLPDNDESMDEFDLLISNCKPLHERLEEVQQPEIARTSTPDFFVTPSKKFSFGIDNLLNDTDL